MSTSGSNAHKWIVLGLVQRTSSLGEVRTAVRIAGHDLTVEHSRFGRQLQQQRDGWELIGEVMPVAAEHGYS